MQQHARTSWLLTSWLRARWLDFSVLPKDKTFGQLVFPFALPYFAYVGLGSIPSDFIPTAPIDAIGALKLVVVLAILWYFRKEYRFGPRLSVHQLPFAIAAGIVATLLWIGMLRLSLELPFWKSQLDASMGLPATQALDASLSLEPSFWSWIFRALGSVILVPIFEELLCRGYLGEYFHSVPKGPGNFLTRLGQPLDLNPQTLSAPPLSALAVIGSTLFFTVGHNPSSWPAAILYFLFTSWVYHKTRSFQICILIHAMANLSIALLVFWRPEMRFLW